MVTADSEFTDENVTKYVNGLDLDELKKFVSDLNADFEEALDRRFRISSNQMDTLKETPAFILSRSDKFGVFAL